MTCSVQYIDDDKVSSQVTNNNLELSQEEGNINLDPDQDSDLDHYLPTEHHSKIAPN